MEKTASMEVKPGFFRLPLQLFQVEAYDHLHARINSCHRKLHTHAITMNVAILNLMGMLYYSVRQVGNALRAFQDALSIDPDSVNSLENISLIYERLSRNKDAKDARQRVQELLQTSVIAQARCLAEQGYALTFGLLEGKENLERFQLSTQYFQAAINLSEQSAGRELACWYLCMGKILHKIVDAKNRKRIPREDVYLECLETFLKAQQIAAQLDGDKTLHAKAWQFLGTLNTKKGGIDHIKIYELFDKYDMVTYFNNLDECFENAIWLDPNNSKHYTRYATSMIRSRNGEEDYQRAIDLLSGCLDHSSSLDHSTRLSKSVSKLLRPLTHTLAGLVQMTRYALNTITGSLFTMFARADDAETSPATHLPTSADHDATDDKASDVRHANITDASIKVMSHTIRGFSIHLSYRWFPLVTRGRLYLQMYRKRFGTIEHLHCAYNDFTESLTIQRPADTLADLGEVCHCLALHYKGNTGQDVRLSAKFTKYMNLALTYFVEATLSLDGDKFSFNHSRYAVCLADYGEMRAAVERYKMALENEDAIQYIPTAFKRLGSCLIQMYESEKAKDVLHELAYWFEYAQAKCGSSKLQSILQQMYNEHTDVIKDLLQQLAHQRKTTLLREWLACLDHCHSELKDLQVQCADMITQENDETSLKAHALSLGEHIPDRDITVTDIKVQTSPNLAAEPAVDLGTELPSCSAGPAPTLDGVAQETSQASDADSDAKLTKLTHSELIESIPFPLEHCKNQHNKKYDFFVLFSENDAQWVYYNLLPKCEKNFHFRGCVEHRDYRLGEPTLDAFQRALEESVCTIVVVTQAFVGDRFSMRELGVVAFEMFQNAHKIIPIMLSPCESPHQLRSLTCLDATKYMDWDRLQRNLMAQCSK